MGKLLKRLFLYTSRTAGLFALARWLTRKQLRVLCYHGFAVGDEARFRPGMFIEFPTFSRRMEYLVRRNMPVLELGQAVELMNEGRLPNNSVVITIDDGFASALIAARDPLARWSLPATVYVTSYHAEKQTPILALVVPYMIWKTQARCLKLADLVEGWRGEADLRNAESATQVAERITQYGEQKLDEPGRGELARKLGGVLGIDYDELVSSRRLSLMSFDDLREIQGLNIDVQLHSHRHRFPVDECAACRELRDNRNALRGVATSPLVHFCYPSGVWSTEHWPWLEHEGVQTAVTCEPGLNDRNSPRLAMKRFLDGENIAQIEFEAEISGFLELLRIVRARLRCRTAMHRADAASDACPGASSKTPMAEVNCIGMQHIVCCDRSGSRGDAP